MKQTGESTMQVPRQLVFGLMVASFFLGIAAAFNLIGDARFHGVRGVDIIPLVAIGWCARPFLFRIFAAHQLEGSAELAHFPPSGAYSLRERRQTSGSQPHFRPF